MKVLAIAKRILLQLTHDRRTMALLLVAPLVLLTLISLLLGSFGTDQAIALVNGPAAYERQLEKSGVHVTRTTEAEGLQLLEQGEISAVVSLVNNRLQIQMDGSSSAAAQVLTKLEAARNTSGWIPADYKSEVTYVYGSAHLEMFDQLGPMLIGLLVFFLVFLVAGISFVQERTSGKTAVNTGKTLGNRTGLHYRFWNYHCYTVTLNQPLCCICIESVTGRFYPAGSSNYTSCSFNCSDTGNSTFHHITE